jgi:hypothetical protein
MNDDNDDDDNGPPVTSKPISEVDELD